MQQKLCTPKGYERVTPGILGPMLVNSTREYELAPVLTAPASAASAITTRICGAEQCGQNGTPCSTACPHLWQGCSMNEREGLA
jgi:hypothetical protein